MISIRGSESETKPYFLRFEEPCLPNTTNSMTSFSWYKKHKEQKKWAGIVNFHVIQRGRPKAPLKRARLTLVRHSFVEPDYDGLVSSFKWLIDGLVKAGVIENDKSSNIGQPSYSWAKAKRGQGKIVVVVEEITEGEQCQEKQ
jgi:hypothetical protein